MSEIHRLFQWTGILLHGHEIDMYGKIRKIQTCINGLKYLTIIYIKVKKPLQDESKLLSDTKIICISNAQQSLPDSELSLSLPQQGFWDLIAMVNYLGKLVDRLSSWDAGCLILSMANFTLVSSLCHLLPLKVTVLTQSEHFPKFIGLATVRAGF